jgi:sec-independent protein translocase protein TatA
VIRGRPRYVEEVTSQTLVGGEHTNRISKGAHDMGLDNPIHIAFLLILLLLVFGAKRLPEMGRSLGDGMRGFKDALGGNATQAAAEATPQAGAQPAQLAQAPQPVASVAPVQMAPQPLGEKLPAA